MPIGKMIYKTLSKKLPREKKKSDGDGEVAIVNNYLTNKPQMSKGVTKPIYGEQRNISESEGGQIVAGVSDSKKMIHRGVKKKGVDFSKAVIKTMNKKTPAKTKKKTRKRRKAKDT